MPLEPLYAAPYDLKQGVGVYVKVISYNTYGDSLVNSEVGNGAVVVFVADKPLDLQDVPSITNAY